MFRGALLGLFLVAAVGCGSMGFTVDKSKLIKTASFDNNCPEDKIQRRKQARTWTESPRLPGSGESIVRASE